MAYDAFLSYSHAADAKIAADLQSALHNLARPWYALRALHVFRDKTSLSANPALWPAIERALSDSSFFLLMASLGSAHSAWVEKETSWWLEHRSAETLFIIITEGGVIWDNSASDFDWNQTTSLPQNLRGKYKDEPLYVDLRWARHEPALSLRHSRFRSAVLDIAAPLHQKPKDEIDGEDVRQHRRVKLLSWAAGLLLFSLTVVSLIAAMKAINNSRRARGRELTAYALMSEAEDPAVALYLGWQGAQASHPFAPGLQRVLDENLLTGNVATLHHQQGVTSVIWSNDGTSVASVSGHGRIRWLDAFTGREFRALSVDLDVDGVAWSPDGKRLAIAGAEDEDRLYHKIEVWDTGSAKKLSTLTNELLIGKYNRENMAWSPDSKSVAFHSTGSIQLSDALTGQKNRELPGPGDHWVNSVAWSPDGKTLASASDDHTISLWDAQSGRQLRIFRDQESNMFSSLAWSPDSKFLASGRKGAVTLWDVESGKDFIALQSAPVESEPLSVKWSPDGKFIASGGEDGSVEVWYVGTAQELRAFSEHGGLAAEFPELRTLHGHHSDVNSVAWSPDSKYLATGSRDASVKLWDGGKSQEISILRNDYSSVYSVAWSPDGKSLAAAKEGQPAIKVWDAATGEVRHTFAQQDPVWCVAWSPDSRILASANDDHTVKLWDASRGKELQVLRGHQSVVTMVAWSPDQRFLASAGDRKDDTVNLWDASTGQVLHTLSHDDQVWGVAWSPDSKWLASACDRGGVVVWDANAGRQLHTLSSNERQVLSVAWGKDATSLASGDSQGTISLWDATTGKVLRTLDGGKAIRAIAWSPDGRILASGDNVGTVRLWDAGAGQELRKFSSHHGEVSSLSWSPDGKVLASASDDTTVRTYPVGDDLLLNLVRERIRQFPLTETQCERYFGSPTCPAVK